MKKILLPIFCVFSVVLLACGTMVGGSGTGSKMTSKVSDNGILVLDVQKVFDGYYKIEEIKKELTAKVDAAQKEFQAMIDQHMKLDKEVKDLNEKAQNPAIAAEAKDKFKKDAEAKEIELRQKMMEVAKFKNEADAQLNQLQQSKLMEQMEVIKGVVGEVSKEKGALVVFSKVGQDVVYADDSLDISDEILKKLNASAPKVATNAEIKTEANAGGNGASTAASKS
ncbi:MAG: OmpH family outer membrane protein [Puniceicoccales bacterium]|nr:OmpH family outer membrane protein [Puniceicoccales bacterium]